MLESFYTGICLAQTTFSKVHVKGHKNWRNLHRQFDAMYVVNIKSTVKISSTFEAFLENMKFTGHPVFEAAGVNAVLKCMHEVGFRILRQCIKAIQAT